MFRHLFQRARLFKEVCRAGNNGQFLLSGKQIVGGLIQFHHWFLVAFGNQQGRTGD